MSGPPRRGYRYRSFFWPALLILFGLVALLVNTNILSADRLYRLVELWPLILVVLGLELLVRRTPMPVATTAAASVLILVIALVGALAYVAFGPAVPGGSGSFDTSQPVAGVQSGSLQIDVGAATLRVRGSGSLDGDLFRAHIAYSGSKPNVSLDESSGRVEISQSSGLNPFGRQQVTLDMQITSDLRWDITVHSGAATDTFDLSNVQVGWMQLDTGASRDDISLAPPSGTVAITINGAELTVHLHRPEGTAAEVAVSGSAVSLDFDGRQEHAVGSLRAGTQGTDMYRVTINGAACTVTMDTGSPSG